MKDFLPKRSSKILNDVSLRHDEKSEEDNNFFEVQSHVQVNQILDCFTNVYTNELGNLLTKLKMFQKKKKLIKSSR